MGAWGYRGPQLQKSEKRLMIQLIITSLKIKNSTDKQPQKMFKKF